MTHDPTALRWLANRATRIRADARVRHTGRDGDGGTAARAARMMIELPRIGDRTKERVYRRRTERKLMQPRLAEQDGTRLVELAHDGRIVVRNPVLVHETTAGRANTVCRNEILDGHGNPVQRASVAPLAQLGVRPMRLCERVLSRHGDVAVERTIEALDTPEHSPSERNRRRVTGTQSRAGVRQSCVVQFVHRTAVQ